MPLIGTCHVKCRITRQVPRVVVTSQTTLTLTLTLIQCSMRQFNFAGLVGVEPWRVKKNVDMTDLSEEGDNKGGGTRSRRKAYELQVMVYLRWCA